MLVGYFRWLKSISKKMALLNNVNKVIHSNRLLFNATTGCLYAPEGIPKTFVVADPIKLTKEVLCIHLNIREELNIKSKHFQECIHYYFDNEGKLFRPVLIVLMAKALNVHQQNTSDLLECQLKMAMIAEMIHTASLLHDDVIDDAVLRRNKPSVNQIFSSKQSILAGDFILARASILLSRLQNTKVVEFFSEIIHDLVKGELMQLVSKDDIDQRFNHYLTKTFRKTASLMANSCKSVALLANCSSIVQDMAFEYGKNLGMAFQLVDDALDIISSSETLGKPAGVDMSLGLATAPVLFAAQKFPDLHAIIGRRFKNKVEDVQKALEYVNQSDGVSETFMLASKYAMEACKSISSLKDSEEKAALITLANFVVERKR
ncbi:all trans-polyprenyl-diphosphate synthase PDSS1 isoform X1 [Hydra vulgaris]|uniref:Decaprenyl-diphosphate synthase subunit 1 n=1 Tax=Hydra vulgaris TaxID=6087 RepID=T2MCH6_HYDVU|nr:all trans-polyprenyl-diphosphate synthase PDSS1 [Hydra vulgaris]